jgi:hypothetical protein
MATTVIKEWLELSLLQVFRPKQLEQSSGRAL